VTDAVAAAEELPAAPAGSSHWRSQNLMVLSGVSLMQDTASELLYPILPIFLTVTLGAPAAVVGAVEGIAEGSAAVTKLLAGKLADRRARRPLIALGYGLAALGKVLVAIAGVWPVVLAGRAVDRVGKGLRGAPRDALLIVGIPAPLRGRAFGFHRAADTTGAVIGPLLGLAAYELLDHHLRPLLLLAVVPAVLSVALVALVREGPRPQGAQRTKPAHPPAALAPRSVPLPADYRRVVTVLALVSLANFPDALLLLRLHDIGFAIPEVIGAYVTYNAVYAALSYPLGALSDRLPRQRIYALGLLAFSISYLGLGLTHNHILAWALLAFYGTFTAATDGVGKAWASSLAGPERQGSAQGIYQGSQGAAILIAGLWAGLAWNIDGQIPLILSGAVTAVVAVGLCVRSLETPMAATPTPEAWPS